MGELGSWQFATNCIEAEQWTRHYKEAKGNGYSGRITNEEAEARQDGGFSSQAKAREQES